MILNIVTVVFGELLRISEFSCGQAFQVVLLFRRTSSCDVHPGDKYNVRRNVGTTSTENTSNLASRVYAPDVNC
jgi:hypothetical protein